MNKNIKFTKSSITDDKKLIVGNVEENFSDEEFLKIKNNTSSTIKECITITNGSSSIIYKNKYYLRKYNCNDDLLFYNGQIIYIKKDKYSDNMYRISNIENEYDQNFKCHYVTSQFLI